MRVGPSGRRFRGGDHVLVTGPHYCYDCVGMVQAVKLKCVLDTIYPEGHEEEDDFKAFPMADDYEHGDKLWFRWSESKVTLLMAFEEFFS